MRHSHGPEWALMTTIALGQAVKQALGEMKGITSTLLNPLVKKFESSRMVKKSQTPAGTVCAPWG